MNKIITVQEYEDSIENLWFNIQGKYSCLPCHLVKKYTIHTPHTLEQFYNWVRTTTFTDIYHALDAWDELNKCPMCQGLSDNGLDNCIPQSAYMCTKCCQLEDKEK